jgi:hypothetical protein
MGDQTIANERHNYAMSLLLRSYDHVSYKTRCGCYCSRNRSFCGCSGWNRKTLRAFEPWMAHSPWYVCMPKQHVVFYTVIIFHMMGAVMPELTCKLEPLSMRSE